MIGQVEDLGKSAARHKLALAFGCAIKRDYPSHSAGIDQPGERLNGR